MVNFNSPIISINAGAQHSAFITKDNDLFMCGSGAKGQLGIEECESVFNPVKVKEKVKAVACGESHTMVLTTNGTILTAGSNEMY